MDIKELPQVVMLIGITAVIATVFVLLFGNVQSQISGSSPGTCYSWVGRAGGPNCSGDYINDSLGYGTVALRDLMSWQGIVVIILIASILIGAVVMFGRRRQL